MLNGRLVFAGLAWLALLLSVSACPLLGDDDDDDTDDGTVDDDSADDDDADDDDADDDDADDDDADDDNDDDNDADDDDNDDADDDDDDNDDTTPPETWGGVSVSEGYSSSNYTALDYYCGAGASFYDPDDVPGWGDPLDENGDCILYAVSGGGTAMDTLSAGAVTVTGTNIGAIHLTPTPYAYGYYYQADVNFLEVDNLFDSGDNLAAHINGQGQFDELDLQLDAPPLINVTQPANFDSLSGLPSTDVTFRWNAGGADTVSLTVGTYNSNGSGRVIACTAPDSQGEILVDGELTSQLLSSPYTFSAYLAKLNTTWAGDDRPVSLTTMTYRQRTYISLLGRK